MPPKCAKTSVNTAENLALSEDFYFSIQQVQFLPYDEGTEMFENCYHLCPVKSVLRIRE